MVRMDIVRVLSVGVQPAIIQRPCAMLRACYFVGDPTMRRMLVLALTLLLISFTASAQDLTPVHFEISDIQISPDGRHAVFSVLTSLGEGVEPQHLEEEYFKEIFLLELATGIVKPLALQPYGPQPCFERNPDRYVVRESMCRIYTQPVFLADNSHVVWGGIWSGKNVDGDNSIFYTAVQSYEFETGVLSNRGDQSLLIPWVDVVVLAPYLMQGGDSQVFTAAEYPIRGGVSQIGAVYDFSPENFSKGRYPRSFVTFARDFNADGEIPPIHWVWADYNGKNVLVGGSRSGSWFVYDLEAAAITETAYSPVADVGGEVLTYIFVPDTEAPLSGHWQITTVDSELQPEEVTAFIREHTNRAAWETIILALGQALTAEFVETGFSLHPGMTAIFDEFQIYDVLGVEREDTLLVPLEWRLAQPPEGESRPLDVTDPIPFPGVG